MKTWLHSHRIRKSISDAVLPMQRHDSVEVEDARPQRPLPVLQLRIDSAARIAASHIADRMSIERYLSAPLEDEPASAPAIDSALKKHPSRDQAIHSHDSSDDANSEGHRTCHTSGSVAGSTGTSYSVVSRANYPQRSTSRPDVPEVPKTTASKHPRVARSPERPTTARTADTERSWAPHNDAVTPMQSPDQNIDFKAKADAEIARIQEQAKVLEEQMRRRKASHDEPRVTDEIAYAKMAQRPKLAWILGGDESDVQSIKRPKSSVASLVTSPIDDMPGLPNTSWLHDGNESKAPRKAKSTDALDTKARRAAGLKHQSVVVKSNKRPRFYCTFCQTRFQNRTEWMKHEQTVHMPAELWVCCPRTGDFPQRCPFCAKRDPSPSHLADHNYLSCQSKALSERTFSRQDQFLQHVSQEHKVSPDQKPLRLRELLDRWRHPLPLKLGHQALHCGFCGQVFSTYHERTEHVAAHFMAGLDMMSWWTGRIGHEIAERNDAHSNPGLPHQCGYCERVYENLATAQKLHPVCTMWSCSFLPGMQHTIYPAGPMNALEAVCCYCNEALVKGTGRVKGAVLKEHIAQHNFRNCSQRLYFSGQRFRQHLQDSHRTNNDATLFAGWTLLVKTCKKSSPSVFDPVDAATTHIRRAITDPNAHDTTPKPSHRKKDKQPMDPQPQMNFMDLSSESPQSSPPRKLRKSSFHNMRESLDAEPRPSTTTFRGASIDVAAPSPAPPLPLLQPQPKHKNPGHHREGFPVTSPPMDAGYGLPRFYRKKLDASTRNRLFVRDEADGRLGKGSQRAFGKVPGGLFGGLVLRSSLIAGAPVRMMNGVDVYYLH